MVCGLLSGYGEGVICCNTCGESSLIVTFRGLLSGYGGGPHLYLLKSDSSLFMMSMGILSRCGKWLLSSSSEFFS